MTHWTSSEVRRMSPVTGSVIVEVMSVAVVADPAREAPDS